MRPHDPCNYIAQCHAASLAACHPWPRRLSFRSPASPLQHPNRVKNTYRGHSSFNIQWRMYRGLAYVQRTRGGEVGRVEFRHPWPPLQRPRLCLHSCQVGRAG